MTADLVVSCQEVTFRLQFESQNPLSIDHDDTADDATVMTSQVSSVESLTWQPIVSCTGEVHDTKVFAVRCIKHIYVAQQRISRLRPVAGLH